MGEALRPPLLRRNVVLGALFASALAAFLALLGLLAVIFVWPQPPSAVAAVPSVGEEPWATRPLLVDGVRGWLVRQPDGEVRAFWARSTHRGCYVDLVPLSPDEARWLGSHPGGMVFFDVCSHARWDLRGERVYGPAPNGLHRFVVGDEYGSHIEVDLGRIQYGHCYTRIIPKCSTPDDPRFGPGPARTLP